MKRLAAIVIVAAATTVAAAAHPDAERVAEAAAVLTSALNASEGIPKDILEEAVCVGVFPGASKQAFGAGQGAFARGIFTCRRPDGTMGAPAFYTLSPGHSPWPFGGEKTDLVVLVMTPEARHKLVANRLTLGGDSSTVAGPLGRDLSTQAQLDAGMLSWAHAEGSVSGASLEGHVLAQDTKTTVTFYGSPIPAKELLLNPTIAPPKAAEHFVRLTNAYANPAS
jgi:lipid-binding SYLF domain-containing protein